MYTIFDESASIFLFLDREASCHIVITSYQIAVGDESFLKQIKWQYMILYEARAIKSANR